MATPLNAQKILDKALQLAEKDSWQTVQLHTIADALGVPLTAIMPFYQSKDQLMAAWFARADNAMLKALTKKDAKLTTTERIHHLLMAWLTALAKHRQVTRAMLYEAGKPGQIRHSWQALNCLRRSTEWLYEALQREQTFLPSTVEKTTLGSLLITTLIYWLQDHSPQARNTEKFLRKELQALESGAHLWRHWCYQPYQQLKTQVSHWWH